MAAAFARFLRDCSGATALEYAVIGSLISVAIVAAAATLGTQLNSIIGAITGNFN